MKTSKALKDYHRRLVAHLEASASADSRVVYQLSQGSNPVPWPEDATIKGYSKGLFRRDWSREAPSEIQLKHIRYWLAQPMAEDKLIAILWLKNWLKVQGRGSNATEAVSLVLALLEDVFAAGDIHDWSTNDWLCVRVLETIVEKYPQLNHRLMGWLDAEPLWRDAPRSWHLRRAENRGSFTMRSPR